MHRDARDEAGERAGSAAFGCPPAPTRPRARAGQVLAVTASAATAIGALALLASLLQVDVMAETLAGWIRMKPNTAVGLVLAGSSVLLLHGAAPHGRRTVAARALAAAAVVLGAATLSQDVSGQDLGIDTLLLPEEEAPDAAPARHRMAPATAIGLMMAGIAAMLRSAPGHAQGTVGQGFALAVAAIGYLVLVGDGYGVSRELWMPRATAMALHTAMALVLLAVALLCSWPDRGLVGTLASRGLGGQLARRLLPAAVLIPSALGLLRLLGEAAGLYDTPFGTAAHVTATILLFAGVTWQSAVSLDRLDAERLHAMQATEAEGRARDLEHRRLRAVLDVLPLGVFLADRSGRVAEMNEAARAVWGRDATPLERIDEYGKYKAWSPVTGQRLRSEQWGLARSLLRGESCSAEELEIETFEGQRKTILNYATPIRDERGAVTGAVAVNVDITERKRAEVELRSLKSELEERVLHRTAELAAANAELEAFSSSVSHDLRAPLRWVDGFALALSEDCAEGLGDTGRAHVRKIRESVRRMAELIDALLQLSRVTRVSLDRETVDLSAVARELAEELDASGEPRRVVWAIADDLRAEADPRLVRVVLDNLLRNAWKFTRVREVAHVQVGAEDRGGERIFFVRDDGAGFDMEHAARLFRSFERLHRAEEFEGVGIGLALVKRVVERHGGRAWAEGRPDEGATISFTLGPPRRSG